VTVLAFSRAPMSAPYSSAGRKSGAALPLRTATPLGSCTANDLWLYRQGIYRRSRVGNGDSPRFTMGLQNAMITKISSSVIRTTHLTGTITDIGIVIGRLSHASSHDDIQPAEEMTALRLLISLLAA